jgi:hypothetical protein
MFIRMGEGGSTRTAAAHYQSVWTINKKNYVTLATPMVGDSLGMPSHAIFYLLPLTLAPAIVFGKIHVQFLHPTYISSSSYRRCTPVTLEYRAAERAERTERTERTERAERAERAERTEREREREREREETEETEQREEKGRESRQSRTAVRAEGRLEQTEQTEQNGS